MQSTGVEAKRQDGVEPATVTRRRAIGAESVTIDGTRGVHFRVWAPTHETVTLVVEPTRETGARAANSATDARAASSATDTRAANSATDNRAANSDLFVLDREPGGHHSLFVPGLGAGTRYRFRLGDSDVLVADPASRFQPEGPFGPSEVIDPAFAWTDRAWRGVPADKHVLYEMHIGTFTPEGTWAAAIDQLPVLAEIGITTLEVMPLNEFAGAHNWGYDGVNWFAPTRAYGRPDDVRSFVDRAHACGLAVILDVVYNHFGPAGNSMFEWCPHYKREGGTNDWGDELAFEGESCAGMRELAIENAAYWIDEFHLDGLRLDATQAIRDESDEHVLAALARHARAAAPERAVFIVGENEPQDSALFELGIDALWNDDFHHTARVALTGVRDGYLHDYHGTPQELLSAVKHGFLYQGQIYPWQKNPRGTPVRGIARSRFVQFLENHDQIANLGFGERLVDLVDGSLLRAMTGLLLLSPQPPMLFQGQEYGSRALWNFFVDHSEELRSPIREGRAKFMAQFARMATEDAQRALRDPSNASTFQDCVLDPRERRLDAPLVQLHRDLLRIRRETPAITGAIDGALLGPSTFCIRYQQPRPEDERLLLINLGVTFSEAIVPEPLVAPIAGHGWHTIWSSEDPRYGGHGTPPVFTRQRLAIPAHAAVLLAPDDESLRVIPAPPDTDKPEF
jgi:maltooligosyltrehalose trehalohydrolase